MKVFIVEPALHGMRLDVFLAQELNGVLSRSRIQAIIKQGGVSINKAPQKSTKHSLVVDDEVSITLPDLEPATPEAQNIPLHVLYEDDALIVIDKPAGITVHPGAGQHDGTLVNALLHHCKGSLSGVGGVARPGIVHRLDKDTSGVMVIAKHDIAHRALAEQFADHGKTTALERTYTALIWGAPHPPVGKVDAPLGRHTSDRTRRAVVVPTRTDARHAVTHYKIDDRYDLGKETVASRMTCRLETGRTHQIRVHFAHLGHPLIGDMSYGRHYLTKASAYGEELEKAVNDLARQALHAKSLTFSHPITEEVMTFETEPPADFLNVETCLKDLTS